jgi:methylated-DNA-protein-cysteine methyltransferase related protein
VEEYPDLPPGPYELSEALVLAARLVPPGRALSYGGLAGLLGAGGPRQAGRAMSTAPDGTAWWRIVRADGSLPASLAARAAPRYRAEGTPLAGHRGAPAAEGRTAQRVDLSRARWEPEAAALAVLAELRDRLG